MLADWSRVDLSGTEWQVAHSLPSEFNPTVDVIGRISSGEMLGPDWIPATVPGDVQSDALDAGLISDINYGLNSRSAEWTYQRDWTYYRSFTVSKPTPHKDRLFLCFGGVDYVCDVFLNQHWLGRHEGAWSPFEFEVTNIIRFDARNDLVVVVEHAPDQEGQWGRTSQVRNLKARFAYGWDWCTRMVPLGIWKEVALEARGNEHLATIWIQPEIAEDYSKARIRVQVQVDAAVAREVFVNYRLYNDLQEVLVEKTVSVRLEQGRNKVDTALMIDRPKLWYPNGYGEQPLYSAACTISDRNGDEMDHCAETFGIRNIEAVQNKNAPPDALPYEFRVNGKTIFLKGWNWTPVRQLYGREHREIYRRRLELARNAHCTILRVWGGGLAERKQFYELCDQYGILVWQELFQSSACIDNHPPMDHEYIALLQEQAAAFVTDHRNHPSIAAWCGGNELCIRTDVMDESGRIRRPELVGLEGYSKEIKLGPWRPLNQDYPTLAALGKTVKELDPSRMWYHTSASGPVENASLDALGSMHDVHGPWIYLGPSEHYRFYNEVDMLVHSEFGCDGSASVQAIKQFVPAKWQWPLDDKNPVAWHHGRMWSASNLSRTEKVFGPIHDLETYVRASQHVQAEGLRYALEAHSRRESCSGAMIWHMAEPWPNVCDTCSIDFYNQAKPSYYAVARANRNVHVSAKYPTIAWHGLQQFKAELWIHNATHRMVPCHLYCEIRALTGRLIFAKNIKMEAHPESAGAATEIIVDTECLQEELFLLTAVLKDDSGTELSRHWSVHSLSPEAPLEGLREMQAAEATIRETPKGVSISNAAAIPIIGLWLEPDLHDEITFGDNWLCLLPHETMFIPWEGPGRKIRVSAWNLVEREIQRHPPLDL